MNNGEKFKLVWEAILGTVNTAAIVAMCAALVKIALKILETE